LAQEIATLKQKLAEDIANVKQEQTKSGGATAHLLQPKTAPPSPATQTIEKLQFPFTSDLLGGLVSHLTAKCGGNVHAKGAVEITASSASSEDNVPETVADFGTDSCFMTDNKPSQWICWNFKALRLEPTHYTIRHTTKARIGVT
jgi:hypothetical protein